MSHFDKLTASQIQFLQSKGFKQDHSRYSGLFFLELGDCKTFVLFPEDGTFKMEIYTPDGDEEIGRYWDLDKFYAKPDQSLEDFITSFEI